MLEKLATINFVKIGKILCLNNLLLVILVLVSSFYIKLNWGIDFSSGTMYEIVFDEKKYPDISQIRDYLDQEGYKGFFVQNFGSDSNIAIKIKTQNSVSEIVNFKESFSRHFEIDQGYSLSFYKTGFVGAGVSASIVKSGIISVMLALIGVMGYLSFRFNIKFAIVSIIALIHDIFIIFGFFFVTRLEFNTSSVTAILTIIGYSINDTVVIFDRIRNLLSNNMYNITTKTVNTGILNCFKRTTLTSCTTMASCLTLVLFTRGEIKDFGIVVMFGVFVGTISSIFIATSLIDIFYHLEFRLEKRKNTSI